MGKGSPSTAGLEAAARESNALQREMYEAAVERGEPFYEGGLSGFQTLLDYMGLPGGASSQTRTQIYDELAPQYTTQQQAASSPMGNMFTDRQGNMRVFDPNSLTPQQQRELDVSGTFRGIYGPSGEVSSYTQYQAPATSQDIIDTQGLNAAVDARMAAQAAGQPDYFGSLLQPFSTETFETDPGYAFRQAEGQKAIERAMAARGTSFTPAAIEAMNQYNQDLASQEYANAYNRYNIDQGNIYNRLAGIAGMGQQQIGQLNQAGQQYAGNVGATNASLAQSQMAAQQAAAQNRGSMFGSLLGLGSSIALAPTTGGGSVIGGLFG